MSAPARPPALVAVPLDDRDDDAGDRDEHQERADHHVFARRDPIFHRNLVRVRRMVPTPIGLTRDVTAGPPPGIFVDVELTGHAIAVARDIRPHTAVRLWHDTKAPMD